MKEMGDMSLLFQHWAIEKSNTLISLVLHLYESEINALHYVQIKYFYSADISCWIAPFLCN